MPETGLRRPRAATSEDWDDATDATAVDGGTPTRVGKDKTTPGLNSKGSYERKRRDGSDSGYSSKTGTVSSDRPEPQHIIDSLTGATVTERQRQPYSMAKSPLEVSSQTAARPKSYFEDLAKSPAKAHRREGKNVGWHAVDRETARMSHQPESPKTVRAPRASSDDHAPRLSRRLSSSSRPRPMTMYGALPSHQQFYTVPPPGPIVYSPQLAAPPGWSNPTTPIAQYSPVVYSPNFNPGATMGSNMSYMEQAPQYYDHPQAYVPVIHPPKPSRRLSSQSIYGDPVIRQKSRSRSPEKTRLPLDEKSHNVAQRAKPHDDFDRMKMPPPPRPPHLEAAPPRRPSLKDGLSHSGSLASTTSNRRSIILEDDYTPILPPVLSSQIRRASPKRPPTSYRGPSFSEGDAQRPVLPKSASYSNPTHVTKIATSTLPRPPTMLSRRTTFSALPTVPSTLPLSNTSPVRERHEIEAETYQAALSHSNGTLTPTDRAAEVLAFRTDPNTKRGVSERSDTGETGSSRSHRSRGSGSGRSSGADGSSKGRRGSANNRDSLILNINGIDHVIPRPGTVKHVRITTASKPEDVVIDLGGTTTGQAKAVSKEEYARPVFSRSDSIREHEPPRLERANSVTSRTSRASDSHSGSGHARDHDRKREYPREGHTMVASTRPRKPSREESRERAYDVDSRSSHRRRDESEHRRQVDRGRDRDPGASDHGIRRESSSRRRAPEPDALALVHTMGSRNETAYWRDKGRDQSRTRRDSDFDHEAPNPRRPSRGGDFPASTAASNRRSSYFEDGDPLDFAPPLPGQTVVRRYSIRGDDGVGSRSQSQVRADGGRDGERSLSRVAVRGEREPRERSESRRARDRDRERVLEAVM